MQEMILNDFDDIDELIKKFDIKKNRKINDNDDDQAKSHEQDGRNSHNYYDDFDR